MATPRSAKRSELRDNAFAYIDSWGRRRLPIHDESHVRNALARFSQVVFEELPEPESLFQLVVADLPGRFPPPVVGPG